jgi:hypothetical protein
MHTNALNVLCNVRISPCIKPVFARNMADGSDALTGLLGSSIDADTGVPLTVQMVLFTVEFHAAPTQRLQPETKKTRAREFCRDYSLPLSIFNDILTLTNLTRKR